MSYQRLLIGQHEIDLQVTAYNVGLCSFYVSYKALAELHPLAWFGSYFTILSSVGHVLYADSNLHLFLILQ